MAEKEEQWSNTSNSLFELFFVLNRDKIIFIFKLKS